MLKLLLYYSKLEYSNPSLKGNFLERTPLYKGHNFLAESAMNIRDSPLTKGHLSNKDKIVCQKGCPYYRGTAVMHLLQ